MKTAKGAVAELVDYREDSIVSRELLKKKTGTVTAFAFWQGQGLSEHTAPFDAMVHIIEGCAQITIAGIPHRVSSGEMIIMPAGKPHALHAQERFKMLLIMIRD